MNFVALDLETATSIKSSICQIGITEVIDNVPQDPKSWLVQPEGNIYDGMNIAFMVLHQKIQRTARHFPKFGRLFSHTFRTKSW